MLLRKLEAKKLSRREYKFKVKSHNHRLIIIIISLYRKFEIVDASPSKAFQTRKPSINHNKN